MCISCSAGCHLTVALCVDLYQSTFALQAQEEMKGLQAQLQASQQAEAATRARLDDQLHKMSQVWDSDASLSLSMGHKVYLLVLYTAVLATHNASGPMHLSNSGWTEWHKRHACTGCSSLMCSVQ